MTRTSLPLALAALVALVAASPSTAPAQPPAGDSALPRVIGRTPLRGLVREPVTVVLVDRLPAMREVYPAAVLRAPGPAGRDFILLTPTEADGALLDAAMRALLSSRARDGMTVTRVRGRDVHALTLGVRRGATDAAWTRAYAARAQHVVDSLAVTPPRAVPGFGRVRALEFLPPIVVERAAGQ